MDIVNTFYTCPYCKEEYTEPGDLARCILSCEAEIKAEEERAERERLKAEKDARYKEITQAQDKLAELMRAYVRDYGSFNSTKTTDDDGFSMFWKHYYF